MSCVCNQILVEIRELKDIVNDLAGQGRAQAAPDQISLSLKEIINDGARRRAHSDELARKRKEKKLRQ